MILLKFTDVFPKFVKSCRKGVTCVIFYNPIWNDVYTGPEFIKYDVMTRLHSAFKSLFFLNMLLKIFKNPKRKFK